MCTNLVEGVTEVRMEAEESRAESAIYISIAIVLGCIYIHRICFWRI